MRQDLYIRVSLERHAGLRRYEAIIESPHFHRGSVCRDGGCKDNDVTFIVFADKDNYSTGDMAAKIAEEVGAMTVRLMQK